MHIDPMAEQYSFQTPYAYAANDPIKFIDQNGENPVLGAFIGAALDVAIQVTSIALSDKKDASDFSWKSVGVSTVGGALGVGIAQ